MANLSKIKREKMLEYLEKLKVQNNNDENIRANSCNSALCVRLCP